jgi:hypothetical protein
LSHTQPAHIEGYELPTRRDIVPNELDHKLFPTIGGVSTYLYRDEEGKTRYELLKLPQLAINLSQLLC